MIDYLIAAAERDKNVSPPLIPTTYYLCMQYAKILVFHADNESMIQVCKTGRNPTMRHIGRTHRVNIAMLNEICLGPSVWLRYIETSCMAADIFTKHFADRKRLFG